MRRNRRRQIIVNKPLQSRIVLSSMWVPCACLMTSTMLFAVFCRRLFDELAISEVDVPSLIPVFLLSVGFLVVAIGFTLFNGIRISHRIAGPVVNIELTLKRFMAGDRSARIRLRRRDLLLDAADRMNTFLDWAERNVAEDAMVAEEPRGETSPEKRETVDSVRG